MGTPRIADDFAAIAAGVRRLNGEQEPKSNENFVAEEFVVLASAQTFVPRPGLASLWTQHDGGLCPVSPDTRVKVRLRDGSEKGVAEAKWFRWSHWGASTDVVEYMVM